MCKCVCVIFCHRCTFYGKQHTEIYSQYQKCLKGNQSVPQSRLMLLKPQKISSLKHCYFLNLNYFISAFKCGRCGAVCFDLIISFDHLYNLSTLTSRFNSLVTGCIISVEQSEINLLNNISICESSISTFCFSDVSIYQLVPCIYCYIASY